MFKLLFSIKKSCHLTHFCTSKNTLKILDFHIHGEFREPNPWECQKITTKKV